MTRFVQAGTSIDQVKDILAGKAPVPPAPATASWAKAIAATNASTMAERQHRVATGAPAEVE
jgi:hypothetical protein